jgi:hypothetical protein
MTQWIDLVAPPEHPRRIGDGRGERDQRFADAPQVRWIPVRHLELAVAVLLDGDLILQCVHALEVGGVIGIDERADRDEHVARPDLGPGEAIRTRAVDDVDHVLVLVERHERKESLPGIGERDRDRAGLEIEHGRRVTACHGSCG